MPGYGAEPPGNWLCQAGSLLVQFWAKSRNFYTKEDADEGCRRVWMLALGPGVKQGKVRERPVPITSAAATGLEYPGMQASRQAERSIWSFPS